PRKTSRKFNLNRPAKRVLGHARELLEQRREREDVMLQDGSEADHPRAGAADAIVDDMIVRGVSRSDGVQGAVFFGYVKAEASFAKTGRGIGLGIRIGMI